MDEYLTTREVAEILRVRERKVYDMAAEGAIPCRRVTGKLLFPRSELEAWLGGGRGEGDPPAVIAGSHDPLLDWAIRESGSGLATFFDGSLDGLGRVRRTQAMAAGLHVFDPSEQEWNVHTVSRGAPETGMVLIAWARRQQGILLSHGAVNRVRAIKDLKGLRVMRRQPTAGAGLLFDHLIREAGLDYSDLRLAPGYARTEHEAAAAVAEGRADVAPGLLTVARQHGLGFLPTMRERFDLIVNRRSYFEPPMQTLWDFCRTPAFRDRAANTPGYDVAEWGEVRWNGP